MLDGLVPQIEDLQAQGAVVLLKWDGERSHERCTVLVTRKDTGYLWRKNCDDISKALAEAISDYKENHAQ